MHPPRASRLVRILLAAFALAAVVAVLALLALSHLLAVFNDGPDFSDPYGYGVYRYVAAFWALAFGVLGLCTVLVGRWRQRPTAVRDLALCDLALVLALLWPVQIVVAAWLFVFRSGRSRLRWATLAIGGAVFLGGTTWGAVAYETDHAWTANGGNAGPLLGNWHDSEGGRLSLLPDGEYTAESNPSDGLWPWDPRRTTGHWTLTTSPWDGAALSLDGGSVQFDPYGVLSPSGLCLDYGLDQPCDLALRR